MQLVYIEALSQVFQVLSPGNYTARLPQASCCRPALPKLSAAWLAVMLHVLPTGKATAINLYHREDDTHKALCCRLALLKLSAAWLSVTLHVPPAGKA
jgi:hypothetical protein